MKFNYLDFFSFYLADSFWIQINIYLKYHKEFIGLIKVEINENSNENVKV